MQRDRLNLRGSRLRAGAIGALLILAPQPSRADESWLAKSTAFPTLSAALKIDAAGCGHDLAVTGAALFALRQRVGDHCGGKVAPAKCPRDEKQGTINRPAFIVCTRPSIVWDWKLLTLIRVRSFASV